MGRGTCILSILRRKTVQKYCGPNGSDSDRLKALKFEYEYFKGKRDTLNERLDKIKAEIEKNRMS